MKFVFPSIEELGAVLPGYEFIEIVGMGGMGGVYKARQINLDRLVAIKILPPLLDQPELNLQERFRREARAMARLNHSNIVSIYDFGTTSDNQLYFVMEYVDGTDLHQIKKSREISQDEVLEWFPKICTALQYAHTEGIIHRDIKPSNIMINRNGNIKVADFGLAKFIRDTSQTRLTMTNLAMGSADYVAPEALEDDCELDCRADLYAIGVMLYEMLTGMVPRGAWLPPSHIRSGRIDPRFDDIVIEAMDPNRDSRFQEAVHITERLIEIREAPGRRKSSWVKGLVPARAAARIPIKVAPGSGGQRKGQQAGGTRGDRPGTGHAATSPIPPPVFQEGNFVTKDPPGESQKSGAIRIRNWLRRRFGESEDTAGSYRDP
ncbi:MAG: serine/threonine-protein kinase [Verrucomicrobiales bacterium]